MVRKSGYRSSPADIEGLFPLFPGVGEQAASATDAGVVEQKMDLVGRLLLDQLVAKPLEMALYRNVGDVGGDAQPLRQPFDLAQPLGLGHRFRRDVAHRDVAAFGNQLARQLPAHPRAAPGDNGNLSSKILHWDRDLSCLILKAILASFCRNHNL